MYVHVYAYRIQMHTILYANATSRSHVTFFHHFTLNGLRAQVTGSPSHVQRSRGIVTRLYDRREAFLFGEGIAMFSLDESHLK